MTIQYSKENTECEFVEMGSNSYTKFAQLISHKYMHHRKTVSCLAMKINELNSEKNLIYQMIN